jgi:hypothetical protein
VEEEDDFGTVEDPVDPRTKWVDPSRIAWRQEGTRGLIAMILLALLGIALVGSLLTAGSWAEMKELLEIWLPALTGLLGSAVGFYFGTRS